MKRISVFFAAAFIVLNLFGAQVSVEQAKQVASNFLGHTSQRTTKTTNFQLTDAGDIFNKKSPTARQLKSKTNPQRDLYVFNIGDNNGFIIISGDDAAMPVLGYSRSGSISSSNAPQNVIKWLEGYRQQIKHLIAANKEATEAIEALWKKPLQQSASAANTVSPLLTTQWNQAPYVNAYCPHDNDYNELTVTGCPATAMAQILKYWNYPTTGIGFHSYQHSKYGSLSANFGNTTYNWSAMPNVISSANDAVATLMYHCGVAVEMNYNVSAEGGSGSYVIKNPTYYSDDQTCENAYVKYFGYSPSIQGLSRDNYTDAVWKNLIKTELDAGRPVQYAGFGQGGHTFVCDGYDANDYFHMNWGWGGYYDGFFLLDALNPGEGGIGSGAGTYNQGQQALIGIKPASQEEEGGNTTDEFGLTLYGPVTTGNTTINYGDAFTVSCAISNGGEQNFTGDLSAAIFDENNTFIEFVETKENITLNSGFYYVLDFSSIGSLEMLPGNYAIYIFSRTGNSEWSMISEGFDNTAYVYMVEVNVVNNNNIALNSSINVTTEDIITNGNIDISVEVGNYGVSDFSGIVDINLFNLDGEFEMVIDEATNTSIQSSFYRSYNFSANNLDVAPGTYLLAVFHKPTGSDYELTGSIGGAPNPVKIIIKESPLEEDPYENNDAVENSYAFTPNFSSGQSAIVSTGSNFHVGSDWDFFSIELEDGYDYEIDMRIHDSYSSADGNTYSVDALFLYSLDGINWSETFDDVMPSAITTEGNKTLYCVTSPYFLGEKGNYVLDIDLNRSTTNNASYAHEADVLMYPTPSSNTLTIETSEILSYTIYTLNGKALLSGILNGTETIDVSSLLSGIYSIELIGKDKTHIKKLIKE